MNKPIYLDNAANTPAESEVLDVFCKMTTTYIANPNSAHMLGKKAQEEFMNASSSISSFLHCKINEIIYTSGATESNNLALKGAAYARRALGKHIISSYLEHSSVLGALMALQNEGFEIDFVDILPDGSIDLVHLKELLRPDTILVSIAAIDSEVGIVQDLKKINQIVKAMPHCVLHTDATQAIGKIPLDYDLYDLMTFSAHKFHGLNGIGALICKELITLSPQIHGGISWSAYRSGTPALALVASLNQAMLLSYSAMQANYDHVSSCNQILRSAFSKYKQIVINSSLLASPYILNISLLSIKAEWMITELEKKGIYVSSKSACCSVNTPSKPVYAITKDRKRASSTIRISLSYKTNEEDISSFIQEFTQIYMQAGGK